MINYRGDGWFLYIIEATNGLIKIGISQNPFRRARHITANSALPARLIAAWQARYADEYALHKRFGVYRAHFEWFRCEGSLAEFVAGVRGDGLPNGVEDWPDFSPKSIEERRKETFKKRSIAMKAVWAQPGVRERWSKQLQNRRKTMAAPQEQVA